MLYYINEEISPIGGEVIAFYLRFIPGDMFVSPTPYSLVKRLDGPSTRDRTYFLIFHPLTISPLPTLTSITTESLVHMDLVMFGGSK